MENWQYNVWFRDNKLEHKEEDYEWNTIIIIEAESEAKAKEWGDKLSKEYIFHNSSEEYIKSDVEKFVSGEDDSYYSYVKYGNLMANIGESWWLT